MPVNSMLTSVFMSIQGGLANAVSGIVPPKEIEDLVSALAVTFLLRQLNDQAGQNNAANENSVAKAAR